MLLIIILYALFASTFTLGKVLLAYSQPIFLTGIRMSIAGGVLFAYQYFVRKHAFKIRKKDISLYIQAMLFSIFLPYTLRFWGLDYMPASKAALLYNLGPFFSYMFAYMAGHEYISWKKVIGLLIGFFGLIPILIAPSPQEDLLGTFKSISWPEIAMIASVACLAYGWIVVRKLLKERKYDPVMVNAISMFSGGITGLTTAFLFEQGPYITNVPKFMSLLMVVIIVSNLMCHSLYTSLLKKYTPTLLAFAGFLSPIFAATYGWFFMGERVSWHFYISIILVVLGLTLFYQEELRSNDDLAPVE